VEHQELDGGGGDERDDDDEDFEQRLDEMPVPLMELESHMECYMASLEPTFQSQ